jgi:hypothetical protein
LTARIGSRHQSLGPESDDVVVTLNIARTDLQNALVAMGVERAKGTDGIVEMAASWSELDKDESEAKPVLRLVLRDRLATPEEYVNIIADGLAPVQAGTVAGPIRPGARLPAADEAGHARAVGLCQ